ncbi:MAG: ATP-binding protein [Bacteroidota bacterium]|nr:ATP-binding protein [Bacteroidota bacterium]
MEALKTSAQLEQEIEELQRQLEEANDTIEAVRTGQVDALIVKDKNGHQLYTLKSADQTYRVFIEKMIEGAVTLDEKGIILYSNSRFASIMNLPLSKIIGSYFETYVPGEYRETFDELIKKGWQTETKGEIYLVTANDELVPFLVSLTTLELDDRIALSLILTDLTIQKNTEKELKEKNEQLQAAQIFTTELNNQLEGKVKERTRELLTSREHFKFLADTIPVIVYTATAGGDIDYFNQQWYNYTGKTFEESKGDGWQSVIHPDDLSNTVITWNRSIKTGEPFKIEDRKQSANGDFRWHLAHALPFKNTDGKIIAWFGVCTDIEDQKKAMRRKDEFISMASHELKTPVTSLKAFTQIMMMTFEGQENEMASSMLGKMDKQINKLTGLIADLLDASKANSGQLNFQQEDFDFNELIKEVTDEIQRTTASHTIELNLTKTETIYGDRNRLAQVIMNLLSNAIKYSPNADRIIISTHTKENEIKFCVQDFGIGIPASQHSKLFTRFFRVTDEKTNTYPGLGLGLFISKEIINRHSGTLDFISTEGKGSTFCFTLPVKNK